jgi:hypothetical protein
VSALRFDLTPWQLQLALVAFMACMGVVLIVAGSRPRRSPRSEVEQ